MTLPEIFLYEDVVAYLKRPPCKSCKINESGELIHCETCDELYKKAISFIESQPIPRPSPDMIGRMKKTHQWVGSKSYNLTKTAMRPWASHCCACGLNMNQFKTKPIKCPKA